MLCQAWCGDADSCLTPMLRLSCMSDMLFGLCGAGDGRQGKWEATGHIVKLQEASEEVTMELRDSSKLPIDTTTGEGLPLCAACTCAPAGPAVGACLLVQQQCISSWCM